MTEVAAGELAPGGVLRAGINLGNSLLVTGEADNGDPIGVAPDMAAEIARRLGVEVTYVTYPSPGELADGMGADAWDIGLIAAEPQRAETIAFSPPYTEIQATYLVPAESPITSIEEVDHPGIRIAISARSAYDLYLQRNLAHAKLVHAQGIDASARLFREEGLDALAGLRPGLLNSADDLGGRVLDGAFTAIQQAIGTKPGNNAAITFLRDFVEEVKASGFVGDLIDRHGVRGRLAVAPPAPPA